MWTIHWERYLIKKNGTICDCKPINIKEMIQKMSWWRDYIGADGLLSMGLHRVGHDWSDLAAAACGKQTKPDLVTVVTTSWEKRDSKYQRHQKYRRLNQSNQTGVPGFILFIPGKKNREETQWPWWKKLEIRWTHFFPFTDFYISQNIL